MSAKTEASFRRYSQASKARQAKLSPEERTKRARERALKRWSTTTPEDRRQHALLMIAGKLNKTNVTN